MLTARVLDLGMLACFPAGLSDEDGEPIHAEVSAVAYDGEWLLLASDKPVPGPGRSSVFAVRCVDYRPQAETLHYLTAPRIAAAAKFEDFALTADGSHVLACTGFDRGNAATAEQHEYNNLLCWPRGRSDDAAVVAAADAGGTLASLALREDLSACLDAPYFKIEGLAAVPVEGGDDRLLFGIREVGRDHADFEYVCRVVAAPYRVRGGTLEFTGDFEIAHDFDADAAEGVRFPVGLSSLEYDPYGDRLFWVTSFETEDAQGRECIGGYLWGQRLDDFKARRPPEPVRGADGRIQEFRNKAEGVAVLDADHLFVVYDNDRNTELEAGRGRSRREPHEAPYTLLTLA